MVTDHHRLQQCRGRLSLCVCSIRWCIDIDSHGLGGLAVAQDSLAASTTFLVSGRLHLATKNDAVKRGEGKMVTYNPRESICNIFLILICTRSGKKTK